MGGRISAISIEWVSKFLIAISISMAVIFILSKLSLAFGILPHQSSLVWYLELPTGGKNQQKPSPLHIFYSLSTTASGRKGRWILSPSPLQGMHWRWLHEDYTRSAIPAGQHVLCPSHTGELPWFQVICDTLLPERQKGRSSPSTWGRNKNGNLHLTKGISIQCHDR